MNPLRTFLPNVDNTLLLEPGLGWTCSSSNLTPLRFPAKYSSLNPLARLANLTRSSTSLPGCTGQLWNVLYNFQDVLHGFEKSASRNYLVAFTDVINITGVVGFL